jgi:hypothetical protein
MYEQGAYDATVMSQGFGKSEKRGTPYFWLEVEPFALIDKYTGEKKEVGRQPRTIYVYITEKTIEFVAENLAAIGYNGSSFSDLDPVNEGHHSFVGQEIRAYCKHEEYDGDMREKWQISGGGGPSHEPLGKSAQMAIDKLFGKHAKANRPSKKNGKAAESAVVNPEEELEF